MPLRLAALALGLTQSATPVPPPPIVTAPPVPERQLLAWMPGSVSCAGAAVQPVRLRRPYLALVYPFADQPKPVDYRFRIDASGRPLSIERVTTTGYVPYADDVGPSLAASRFAAGGERRDCRISYSARRTSYADTPVDDLISYTLNPIGGRLPREGWAAIFPAAATCDKDPRSAPLNQVFPDFDKVAATPGVRDWTMLAYDLDAQGQPTGVRVLTSTGNAALNDAASAALVQSRYTNGPKTGCRFPYYRAAGVLEAPTAPEKASVRPAGATCPREIDWAKRPPLRYPDPYRKRSIEGWALIGFDVAPWGGTGAITVLASEPSADFGMAATQLIREGVVAVSKTGFTGCVERVRFAMGKSGMTPNTEGDD